MASRVFFESLCKESRFGFRGKVACRGLTYSVFNIPRRRILLNYVLIPKTPMDCPLRVYFVYRLSRTKSKGSRWNHPKFVCRIEASNCTKL